MGYKDLTSTWLINGKVKVGEMVNLLNPEGESDFTARNSQENMNADLIQEIGMPPYEVLKITETPAPRYLLTLKGEKGIKKEITKDYFCL